MIVFINLHAALHIEFLNMLIICHHSNFHTSSSNSLVIA